MSDNSNFGFALGVKIEDDLADAFLSTGGQLVGIWPL